MAFNIFDPSSVNQGTNYASAVQNILGRNPGGGSSPLAPSVPQGGESRYQARDYSNPYSYQEQPSTDGTRGIAPVVPALIAGGTTLASGLVNAFSGGGPQGMTPEMQSLLQMLALNNQGAMVDLASQNQFFNQGMSQYPIEVQKAMQDIYNQNYSGAEKGAAAFAQSALSGEQTDLSKQLQTNFAQQFGKQQTKGMSGLNQQLAQSGISPDSPLAQKIMADQMQGYGSALATGQSDIATAQQQRDLQTALGIMMNAQQSNRLAGAQLPGTPPTAAQAGFPIVTPKRYPGLDQLFGNITQGLYNTTEEQKRSGAVTAAKNDEFQRLFGSKGQPGKDPYSSGGLHV